MFSHIIAMSDLGETLITCSFNVSNKLLKIWLTLIIDVTKSDVIRTFSVKYGIPIIFK